MANPNITIPEFMGSKKIYFPELTYKQLVVLELYATGISLKQISTQLDISHSAVKDHIKAIKAKLDCSFTGELRQVYLSRVVCAVFDFLNQK